MAASEQTIIAFNAKLRQILSDGFLAAGICIGSRLGLFDLLAEAKSPLTSLEIANKMKFKERYVREWLSAMVCGGIVDLKGGKFWLPHERRMSLSGSNPMNVASYSWCINMCSNVTDDLMDCFKLEGPAGLPYSKFPLFHEWREQWMNASYTWASIKDRIAQVPGIIEKLEKGIEMCELGCSTGLVTLMLAEHFPNSTIYGYDISEEAVDFATKKAESLGLRNVKFGVQDCCNMPDEWSEKWEYIFVFDLVHDVPQTTKVLREIRRVLKPGCVASIIDLMMHSNLEDNIKNPLSGAVYILSLFHCMTVSLSGEGGEGLGAAWGQEKAMEMLKDAGYSSIQALEYDKSPTYIHYVCSR